MKIPLVLIAVAVASVSGGFLAVRDSRVWNRTANLMAAAALIASEAAFIRLLQVYNSRALGVMIASGNPMAGLGWWGLLALLLSFSAIIAAALGVSKASLLLMPGSILMFSYTLLTLSFWD
jgi:hypothetical protein